MSESFGLSEALELGVLTTLKATLVLVMGWVAAAAFRRRPAAEQHLLWVLVIAGVILLPPLGSVGSGWAVPVRTVFWMKQVPAEANAPSKPAQESSVSGSASLSAPVLVSGGAGVSLSRTESTESAAPPVRDGVPLGVIAMFVWAAGATLLAVSTLLGHGRARQLARRAPELTDRSLIERALRVGREIGIGRSVRLLAGAQGEMPKTGGVLRPWLLLPARAVEWPAARQESVLRHELAHVKRYDTLIEVFVNLACAIYWFHPLIWLAARRLRAAREHACDDVVLLSGMRPSDYAADLLAIAKGFQDRAPVANGAIAMARLSSLRSRLSAVLDDRPRLHRIDVARILPACVGGLVVLVVLGGSRPEAGLAAGNTIEVSDTDVESDSIELTASSDGSFVESEAAGETKSLSSDSIESAGTGSKSSSGIPTDPPVATGMVVVPPTDAGANDNVALLDVAGPGARPISVAASGAAARVTYTIAGRFIAGGTSALRPEIFSAVRGDKYLDSLNMTSAQAGRDGSFNARFVFENLAEFDAWYSTRSAEQLHQAVSNAAFIGNLQMDLAVSQPR